MEEAESSSVTLDDDRCAKGKIRGNKQTGPCDGDLRFLSSRECIISGTPRGTRLCQSHFQNIMQFVFEHQECSCPSRDWAHSTRLQTCPDRLLFFFNRLEPEFQLSGFICSTCNSKVDKDPMFTTHPGYKGRRTLGEKIDKPEELSNSMIVKQLVELVHSQQKASVPRKKKIRRKKACGRGKINGELQKDSCEGELRALSNYECITAGLFNNTQICLYHWKRIIDHFQDTCCCPATKWFHSSKTQQCPIRLLGLFHAMMPAIQLSGVICNTCMTSVDKDPEFFSHPAYKAPRRRREETALENSVKKVKIVGAEGENKQPEAVEINEVAESSKGASTASSSADTNKQRAILRRMLFRENKTTQTDALSRADSLPMPFSLTDVTVNLATDVKEVIIPENLLLYNGRPALLMFDRMRSSVVVILLKETSAAYQQVRHYCPQLKLTDLSGHETTNNRAGTTIIQVIDETGEEYQAEEGITQIEHEGQIVEIHPEGGGQSMDHMEIEVPNEMEDPVQILVSMQDPEQVGMQDSEQVVTEGENITHDHQYNH